MPYRSRALNLLFAVFVGLALLVVALACREWFVCRPAKTSAIAKLTGVQLTDDEAAEVRVYAVPNGAYVEPHR